MKREYNLSGLHYVEFKPDNPLFIQIKSYTPHSCPWDCYGNKWVIEMGRVMSKAKIAFEICETQRKKIAPMGTGPMGRVRFGDDMVPSIYTLYVSKYDDVAAYAAIHSHEKDVENWLYHGGAMPDVMRQ